MFRITRDPSSGSSIQCLTKITVMVLSCPLYTVQYTTHTTGKYAAITPTTSMSTVTIEPLLNFNQARHRTP